MMSYNYSAGLLLLIKYCVIAASFDVFDGPQYYEALFTFRQTEAFNPAFDLFGYQDMNLIMNSGSLPIFFIIMVLFGILYKIVLCLTRKLYKI